MKRNTRKFFKFFQFSKETRSCPSFSSFQSFPLWYDTVLWSISSFSVFFGYSLVFLYFPATRKFCNVSCSFLLLVAFPDEFGFLLITSFCYFRLAGIQAFFQSSSFTFIFLAIINTCVNWKSLIAPISAILAFTDSPLTRVFGKFFAWCYTSVTHWDKDGRTAEV